MTPGPIRYEIDLGSTIDRVGVPEGAIMSFTMELFDYGTPVDIESPDPREVADLAGWLGQLDGG